MSRLAEIYLNEKSAGRGLGSALGKRFLEKADPRRMFDQSGLLATMLPSLFKSYSATSGGKRNVSSLGGRGSSINSPSFSIIGVESKLDDIYISNKIIAKNSMVLPSMHRDINLMRQNISKLVKLKGGNPASRADMFFIRAKDRESQYESQFKKEKSTTGKSSTSGTTSGGGGLLNMIFGGLGKIGEGIVTGAKIGAIGLGIAGFIGSVGFASKFVDAQKLKDVLVAIGTGLGSFNMQTLVSLGSLVAAGTLFGAVAFPGGMGKSIKGSIGTSMGMTAIGVGLAGFVGAIGLVAESINIKKFSDLMMAISTSLNSFNTSSLVALGGLLAAGGIFGAVTAVNPLMGILGSLGTTMGITAIGWGLSSFIKTMAETVVFAEKLGVGNSIANLIIQVSKGLEALSNLNGTNIANVGTGLAGLGTGLLALFGAKGLGAVEDTWIKVKKFFFPDSGDKKGFFDELIPELKKLEQLDDAKIRSVGDGFKNLVDNIKELTKLTDNDVDKVIKLTSAITTPYYGTSPAPTSGKSTFGSIVGNAINTSMGTLGTLTGGAGRIVGSVGGYIGEKIINSNTSPSPHSVSDRKFSPQQSSNVSKLGNVNSDGLTLINQLMDEEGITDQNLRNRLIALAWYESKLKINNPGPVVPKGMYRGERARGLFQLMPGNAKMFGYSKESVENDPVLASRLGLKLFLRNLKKFNGNIDAATVAHHAGDKQAQNFLRTGYTTSRDTATNVSTNSYLSNISSIHGKISGGAIDTLSTQNLAAIRDIGGGGNVINNYNISNTSGGTSSGSSSTIADVADESLWRELIRKRPMQPIT